MSLDATRWAWTRRVAPTRKLVLLALADRADEGHRCYPSIARLEADTGLHRETIMEAIAELESDGYVTVSRRQGSRSVYQLIGVENRHGENPTSGRSPTEQNQSEKADHYQSGKPDRYGKPDQYGKADGGSPEKQTTTSRKKQTHNLPSKPTKEPTSKTNTSARDTTPPPTHENGRRKTDPYDPRTEPIPDCIPQQAWADYCQHRQDLKAPLAPMAAKRAIKLLTEAYAGGQSPEAIIDKSILSGWQGLFPDKNPPQPRRTPDGSHPQSQNWRERVLAGHEWPDVPPFG